MSLTFEVRSATNGAARRSAASRIRIVVVDDLPRTPSGKVKKVELRERLRAEAAGLEV